MWEHEGASEENTDDNPGRSLTRLYLLQLSQPLLVARHFPQTRVPHSGVFGAKAIKEYGLWGSLLVSQVPSSPSQEIHLLILELLTDFLYFLEVKYLHFEKCCFTL